MKKAYTIRQHLRTGLLSMLLFLSSFAYAGEWKVIHQKSDELIGNPDYDAHIYTTGNIQFAYSTKDSIVCVLYNRCVFDCEYSSIFDEFGEYVAVGLYDSSGELLERVGYTCLHLTKWTAYIYTNIV